MEVFTPSFAILIISIGFYLIAEFLDRIMKVFLPFLFLILLFMHLNTDTNTTSNLSDVTAPERDTVVILDKPNTRRTGESTRKFQEAQKNDFLQLDAFENLGNAQMSLEEYQTTFPDAFIHFEDTLYRIWIGPYNTGRVENIQKEFPEKKFLHKKANLILKES